MSVPTTPMANESQARGRVLARAELLGVSSCLLRLLDHAHARARARSFINNTSNFGVWPSNFSNVYFDFKFYGRSDGAIIDPQIARNDTNRYHRALDKASVIFRKNTVFL